MLEKRETRFLIRQKSDPWFWGIFIIIALCCIFFGFQAPVIERFSGLSPYQAPLSLEIHVWSFSAWFVFLSVQAYLAASRKIAFHRKIGWLLIPLVTIMTVSALFAEIHSKRYYAQIYPEQISILSSTLVELACFTVSAVVAFVYRHRIDIHKRLIFLATAILTTAAMRRIYSPIAYEHLESSFLVELLIEPLGLYLFLAAASLYDLATRRRIHPAYLYGGSIILLANWMAMFVGKTEAWENMAIRVLNI